MGKYLLVVNNSYIKTTSPITGKLLKISQLTKTLFSIFIDNSNKVRSDK